MSVGRDGVNPLPQSFLATVPPSTSFCLLPFQEGLGDKCPLQYKGCQSGGRVGVRAEASGDTMEQKLGLPISPLGLLRRPFHPAIGP